MNREGHRLGEVHAGVGRRGQLVQRSKTDRREVLHVDTGCRVGRQSRIVRDFQPFNLQTGDVYGVIHEECHRPFLRIDGCLHALPIRTGTLALDFDSHDRSLYQWIGNVVLDGTSHETPQTSDIIA